MFYLSMVCCFAVTSTVAIENSEGAEQTALCYPNRVVIPEDIAAIETRTYRRKGDCMVVRRTILPNVCFLIGHFQGWRSCIDLFVAKGDVPRNATLVPQSNGEPYTQRGWRAGFGACRDSLQLLIKEQDIDSVIRQCKALSLSTREQVVDPQPTPEREHEFVDPFLRP